jgi:UPF0716 protein FxsA
MVLLLFIALPLAELAAIVLVSELIGFPATLLLLLLSSVLGFVLLRSQGRSAVGRFRDALAERRPPGREALDGALVFAGGALLILPGFVTDIAGALLLAPPTRAGARRLAMRHWSARLLRMFARVPRSRFDVESSAIEVDGTQLTP